MGRAVLLMWIVLIILALVPFLFPRLKPLWCILCWLGPTILALEVDAGNHRWIYATKFCLWVLMTIGALIMLRISNGFTINTNIPIEWIYPLLAAVLVLSCIITFVGISLKKKIWIGVQLQFSNSRALRGPVDKIYANLQSEKLETTLTLKDLRGAKVPTSKNEFRQLKVEEVCEKVLWISFATEYVVRRVFLTDQNKVLVYNTCTHFRAFLLTLALLLWGLWHVLEGFFSEGVQRDIVEAMILWITLPSLTIPSLIRLRFGQINFTDVLRGLLPANNDEQMWERLGISDLDLYAALTNAVGAEPILAKNILPFVNILGSKGLVRVQCIQKARELCKRSLLRVGDMYIRISDGARFSVDEPYELQVVSANRENTASASDGLVVHTEEEELESLSSGDAWEQDFFEVCPKFRYWRVHQS